MSYYMIYLNQKEHDVGADNLHQNEDTDVTYNQTIIKREVMEMKKIIKITRNLGFVSLVYCQSNFAITPKVSFLEPKDGSLVESTFKVKMHIQRMKVCPANIETKNKLCGHHHIIIDGASVAKDEIIKNDETHLHFGKEQSEAELKLTPGKHTLTLQFADYAHKSYGKELSSTIQVDVKPGKLP